MSEHVDNIGERGARRRRYLAWAMAGASVIVVIALAATHAPRWSRLILSLPVGLAAGEFLQAREKT